jgi:hypothetical protein
VAALAALRREARRRWRRAHAGAAPPLSFHAELRDGRYEVRARSGKAEARARLSARFWDAHVASGGDSCARCAARFFEKLMERLTP